MIIRDLHDALDALRAERDAAKKSLSDGINAEGALFVEAQREADQLVTYGLVGESSWSVKLHGSEIAHFPREGQAKTVAESLVDALALLRADLHRPLAGSAESRSSRADELLDALWAESDEGRSDIPYSSENLAKIDAHRKGGS